jgi:3-deoxy-D-manno-octulosonate 8-phosphate phosphatase KdsC-like HAD superfamily phosphatase
MYTSPEGIKSRSLLIETGINWVCLAFSVKQKSFCSTEILFDYRYNIPDLEIMRRVGCPVCPKDACQEIKEVSLYVSDRIGGHGCGRDVIEQTLRAQGKWVMDKKAFGW